MELLKIKNGEKQIALPGRITSYKAQLIDVDDVAGTSEDGFTIRDVRRRNKRRLTVKFDGLRLKNSRF